MDQKNFVIGVLSTTAAVMLVGLILVTMPPAPVSAAGMTATGGDYIMTVGTTPQTDQEYLYVLDVPLQKLIIYRFDANRSVVEIVQGIDLSVFRQTPAPSPGRRQP